MSAIGPKRTCACALHMSAFGGKPDMTLCGNSLSRSLLGVKRTCLFALHMSAFDPKRTSQSDPSSRSVKPVRCHSYIGGEMKRREFLCFLLSGAAAIPLGATAQTTEKVRRIGLLMTSAAGDPEISKRLAAFQGELGRLGWVEG